MHTGVKPYECRICKQTFAQRSQIDKHIRSDKHKNKVLFQKTKVITKGEKRGFRKIMLKGEVADREGNEGETCYEQEGDGSLNVVFEVHQERDAKREVLASVIKNSS